jgi:hypothetical protein
VSDVQFDHDAGLFDEVPMAQEVRPYDGHPTRREQVEAIKSSFCCGRLYAI